jgi:hypothetical protein
MAIGVAYGISSSLSGVQESFMLRSSGSSGPSIENLNSDIDTIFDNI